MKKLAMLVIMLPLVVLADVVMSELSHVETATYVHRLHR